MSSGNILTIIKSKYAATAVIPVNVSFIHISRQPRLSFIVVNIINLSESDVLY